MTARELLALAARYPWLLVAGFALPPLAVWVVGLLHGRGKGLESPWRYLYALLTYLVCVPGMMAAVLVAYTLFFTRENLLDAPLLVYLLPLLSMGGTLLLISRKVSFERLPGFQRLWGLMLLMAITFVVVLAISKTRIWLLFGSSVWTLLLLCVVVYLLLQWASALVAGRSSPES
jgi:hypothetical protein